MPCMVPVRGLTGAGRARPRAAFSPRVDCEQAASRAAYLFILQGELKPSHRRLEIFVKWMKVSNPFSFPLARCACADAWGQGWTDSTDAPSASQTGKGRHAVNSSLQHESRGAHGKQ